MHLEHKKLWENCLQKIKDNISLHAFDAWFGPISSISFDGENLVRGVPSQYFIEHIEGKYLNLLSMAIKNVYGPKTKLTYAFNVVKNEPDTNVKIESVKQSPVVGNRINAQSEGPSDPFSKIKYAEIDSQLNPKFTFENYCGSTSNQLALSIGDALATKPECHTFSPLLVFGPTGVGKTHLI